MRNLGGVGVTGCGVSSTQSISSISSRGGWLGEYMGWAGASISSIGWSLGVAGGGDDGVQGSCMTVLSSSSRR